ncbi:hypothetical protein JCGZ_09989 [Jatropha curcas]|uniref:Uncharacterized protein n=1 Tax=Jatropha curcas TaxID=180498 RepID=A0A067KLX4_JATCU|nr:hypothetical protein JCGZ_09989 [Jatropha curcas]
MQPSLGYCLRLVRTERGAERQAWRRRAAAGSSSGTQGGPVSLRCRATLLLFCLAKIADAVK